MDADVVEKLKAYAQDGQLSFKQALNELIRRGLQAPARTHERPRFEVVPHRGGFRPGIDTARLNQLLDEMDAQDFVREVPPVG